MLFLSLLLWTNCFSLMSFWLFKFLLWIVCCVFQLLNLFLNQFNPIFNFCVLFIIWIELVLKLCLDWFNFSIYVLYILFKFSNWVLSHLDVCYEFFITQRESFKSRLELILASILDDNHFLVNLSHLLLDPYQLVEAFFNAVSVYGLL